MVDVEAEVPEGFTVEQWERELAHGLCWQRTRGGGSFVVIHDVLLG